MSQDRNMKWLNDRKIIYRRDPINDQPTIETNYYKLSLIHISEPTRPY